MCHIMSSIAEVPNPRHADRYRFVGHLVPGRTERINNLHYFRFIYYLSLNDVLFRKMTRFSLLHPSMTHSWRMSRRLSQSRDTLFLKAGPWKYCLTLNQSVAQRGLGTTGLSYTVIIPSHDKNLSYRDIDNIADDVFGHLDNKHGGRRNSNHKWGGRNNPPKKELSQ